MKKNKGKIIKGIFIGVLLLALITVAVMILVKLKNGEAVSLKTEGPVQESDFSEKWQEGNVSYKGKTYRYNSGIKTYLFMGIDKDGVREKAKDGISGGQSDAMFLLVTDAKNKTISIVAINRNTMTAVDVYDIDGNYTDTRELQICLQHAYGDGMQLSGQRAADAVSELFYNIPIAGYMSMTMDGIALLNDAVGGVTLEVAEDMENAERGVSLKKGETVTLKGNEAYVYLRYRDTDTFNSAGRRLDRQMQYLSELFKGVGEAAKDEKKILSIYQSVEDYLVSNVDIVKLAEDVSKYSYDSDYMYSVPGETVMGESLEEYHVDEEALYDMIIELFYVEAED